MKFPGEDEEVDASKNDTATYGDDTMGENTGDSALATEAEKSEPFAKETETEAEPEDLEDEIETVTPDGDN